jgi:hypothetical protein
MRGVAFHQRPRLTRARILGAATGGALVLAGVGGYELTGHLSGAGGAGPAAAPAVAPLLSKPAFERRSGVRVTSVSVSGGGGLVDLRYQVLDPQAADAIHDRGARPEVVDERNHVVVDQLLMGHMHHGQLKAAETYYLIFDNPGGYVRPGTRVTVQLGHSRLSHVPVR